jgi:nicotinamidase-related amidase
VVTKTTIDACESPAFVSAVDRLADEVDALFVTGFWLSACVAATAISCAARFGERLRVVVPLTLAATRLGLYDPADDHEREVDVTARLKQLREAGVLVPDSVPQDFVT